MTGKMQMENSRSSFRAGLYASVVTRHEIHLLAYLGFRRLFRKAGAPNSLTSQVKSDNTCANPTIKSLYSEANLIC